MAAKWTPDDAPSFAGSFSLIDKAVGRMSEARKGIGTGLGGAFDQVGEGIVENTKTELMNLTTDADRAAYLEENPSSFYSPTEMMNFRNQLMATDKKRKKETDRLTILDQSKELDSIADVTLRRQALGEIQQKNKYANINDDEGIHKARVTDMLGEQSFALTKNIIEEAGADPNDETTFNPDVEQKVFDILDRKIKEQYYGADNATIQAKRNEAIRASRFGGMFSRRTAERKQMSTSDIRIENYSHAIMDAIDAQDASELETQVNEASKFLLAHPKLDENQTNWITMPILKALQSVEIDADAEWDRINGEGAKGTIANQNKFGRQMTKFYQDKFRFLPQAVIDKQIANLISRSDTLKRKIGLADLQRKYKTKADTLYMETQLGIKKKNLDILSEMRTSSVDSTISRKIEDILQKYEGPDVLKKGFRAKLMNQVANTVKKVKGLFSNDSGVSTLKPAQQSTLDLALYRFLTNTAAYDADDGWIPFDRPDLIIATMNEASWSDMKDLSEQRLLEGLKSFLPPRQDRAKASRRGGGGVLLEKLIGDKLKELGPGPKKPSTGVPKLNMGGALGG